MNFWFGLGAPCLFPSLSLIVFSLVALQVPSLGMCLLHRPLGLLVFCLISQDLFVKNGFPRVHWFYLLWLEGERGFNNPQVTFWLGRLGWEHGFQICWWGLSFALPSRPIGRAFVLLTVLCLLRKNHLPSVSRRMPALWTSSALCPMAIVLSRKSQQMESTGSGWTLR